MNKRVKYIKSEDCIFRIKNISLKSHKFQSFKTNDIIFKDLYFSIDNLIIPRKGIYFITGESGSGKSTLVNLLGLMLKYDISSFSNNKSGIIFTPEKGHDIEYSNLYKNNLTSQVREKYFGFMFQNDHLIDSWRVSENILLSCWLNKCSRENNDKLIYRAEKYMERLNFKDPKSIFAEYPSELSGGQRQRIALVRAIIKEPKVIIVDEPLASVDMHTSNLIIDMLLSLAKKKCVILVLHDFHYQYIKAKLNEINAENRIIYSHTYNVSKYIKRSQA